jgi:hypothetical protein
LDIALGNEDTVFGILIRSIKNSEGKLIEGPCNCVNEILRQLNVKSISDFTENKLVSITNKQLNLRCDVKEGDDHIERNATEIFIGPRIGLKKRKNDKNNFVKKYYRFTNTRNVKMRTTLSPLSIESNVQIIHINKNES